MTVPALKACKTVYSYRPPEVRAAFDRVVRNGFPHHVIMGGILPPGGLDMFERPIIEMVERFYAEQVPALADFGHCYPTPASEEGIREVMSLVQNKKTDQLIENVRAGQPIDRQVLIDVEPISEEAVQCIGAFYSFRDEYEGYYHVGRSRKMAQTVVPKDVNPEELPPGYWFISNPFAGDGNVIPNEVIQRICEAGHKIFYDMAYLDTTQKHHFDLSHPNIMASTISFSKPYGLFYDRIGFTFSREPIPALFGNKWFKSVFALMIAKQLMSDLSPQQLYAKYKKVQESIIAEINDIHKLGMKPCDTFLLGYITEEAASSLPAEQQALISGFKRGNIFRFCLTPYFFERDPERNKLFINWRSFLLHEGEGILNAVQEAELDKLEQERIG